MEEPVLISEIVGLWFKRRQFTKRKLNSLVQCLMLLIDFLQDPNLTALILLSPFCDVLNEAISENSIK